jgi:hypothetical protein
MALGLNTSSAGGDFIPHVRYDARAGRLFRADRAQDSDGWKTTMVDISQPPPQFIMDIGQIEIGWISYTGGTPDLRMGPLSAGLAPQPSKEHRQGFRVRLYAPKLLGGLREFASNAKAVIAAMDGLHSAYEAAPERQQGLVPVVCLASTTPITTKTPQGSTTNYAPVFRIEKWVPRPAELDAAAAATPVAAPAPSPARHVPPPAAAPPSPPPPGPSHDTEF